MELNWLEQPATAIETSYKENVLKAGPLVYWPLDEETGMVADNAVGNAAYDGSSAIVQYTRNFYNSKAYSFGSTRVNIYSSALNSNMNKAEGSILICFRLITKQDWTPSVTKRLLNIAADDNNRFIIQISTSGALEVFRIASSSSKTVSHDYSATKPLTWQFIILTYSLIAGELKLFVNGVQSGSTQTSLSAFSGSFDAAKVVIGAQDTSNTLPSTNVVIGNVGIWNRVLTTTEKTFLSEPPVYTDSTTLIHTIQASWDIFALTGFAGSTLACFAEDVDDDGELEFVGNIGRRMNFVAIKQNGTILWNAVVDNAQSEGLRFPQIRNGVMYYGSLKRACAIRISDGVILWDRNVVANNPASGLGGMNQSNAGLVIGIGNQLDVLNYTTGLSIGGGFPVTLPYDQWEQSLAVVYLGNNVEHIITNDNFNSMRVYTMSGTLAFSKGPSNNVNENDRYESFDVNDDGLGELVLIGDDDATSTQVAGEGDEVYIYNASGTKLDSYVGLTSGGMAFDCYAWPNGGKIAFCYESDYVSHRLVMLDKDLNEIWVRDVGTPYEGDQFALVDLNDDGIPEMLYSTEVFSENGGFRVIDYQGNPIRFYTDDSPMLADDIVDAKGAAVNIFVSRPPYVWDRNKFIQFTHRTTDNTGHEIIYLHKWTP